MIVRLLIVVIQALCTVFLVSILHTVVRNYWVVQQFKKREPRMPIAPNRSLISNHLGEIVYSRRDTLRVIEENHLKLGPTFAWFYNEQPAVTTTDLELVKRMILDEPNLNINRGTIELPLPECEDNIVYLSDNQWRRVRRAYASALSIHKIKSANVQTSLDQVNCRFKEALDWRVDECKGRAELNLDDLCARWSLDVVFSSFFKQPNIIDYKAHEDYWASTLEGVCRSAVNPITLCACLRILHKPLNWLANFHYTGKFRNKVKEFIHKQAILNFEARREADRENQKRKDYHFEKLENYKMKDGASFSRNLADFIIDRLYRNELTEREYVHSTAFIFMAGGKTLADGSACCIWLLANNPEIQEKLRASLFQHGVDSQYLDWFIHEALRLYPPVNGCCTRKISTDMYTSDGLLIPRGTMVNACGFTVHRLKQFWGEDAEEFRPERWAHAADFHPCQYLTFGLGRRNCPGFKFGLEAFKLLLHSLLCNYKFEKSSKSERLNIIAAPLLMYIVFDKPTFVEITRLESNNQGAFSSVSNEKP